MSAEDPPLHPLTDLQPRQSDGHPLAQFHPLVREWFENRFLEPTAPQRDGWPAIAKRQNTLIAAPTGSGKTLAAFLSCLNTLIEQALAGNLSESTSTVYISPLKALGNDVCKNVEQPLAEIRNLAVSKGIGLPPIRIATRSGDTTASERAKMVKRPPHILITTPETLYILLTSGSGRKNLSQVDTVIVDEIHAIAGDKRGAHLALSLERLDRLVIDTTHRAPIRIGLSATQNPIERIGRLLVGNKNPVPKIIDGGHSRHIDLAIEDTGDELGPIASNDQCGRMYDRIAELISEHETTLVFANTRRLVEKASHNLEERLGEESVVAHHGSLSKQIRLKAEEKLKTGKVKCAVATASLELGIDVGTVDLVIQIGSPRSISTLLQRIGRSGHSLGKTPKGRLFALTRDQLTECTALCRAIKKKRLDEVHLFHQPLDVLSQQIVATVSAETLSSNELFEMVVQAAPYKDLSRKQFDDVLNMLAEGASPNQGRRTAQLHWDRLGDDVRPRRGARLAAITNGGAIPDTATYPVIKFPEEIAVGSLDEDFAIESAAGDIFLLGNTAWRVRRVEAGRVLVEDAKGQPPNIPFWFGEAPARTYELSDEIGLLRKDIAGLLKTNKSGTRAVDWLQKEICISEAYAKQLVSYIASAVEELGAVPTRKHIIAERFFDEAGGMQLVIHSPLGARINKAWGLALRKRFCRSFNLELQAAATDDGIVLSLGPVHSFPLEEIARYLPSEKAEKTLRQAVLGAPVFGVRWRWAVTRALAVLRRYGGKKVPPHILRMRTDDLLSLVFPMQQACLENVVGDIDIPDHPLVFEAMRDCLSEFMDIAGLVETIQGIESKTIQFSARDTAQASQFSHELVNANPYAFLDEVPAEERRTRAVHLPRRFRQGLSSTEEEKSAEISRQAIAKVEEQAFPPIRDAEELHDALLTFWVLPKRSSWERYFEVLARKGRATAITVSNDEPEAILWVAAERLPALELIFEQASFNPNLPTLDPAISEKLPKERSDAMLRIVEGHMEHLGPRSSGELARALFLTDTDIEQSMLALEAKGALLRRTDSGVERFCDRRMLARIHRSSLATLRKQVEPVSAAVLMRFLFRWQRATPEFKLLGENGLTEIITQLQGFESASGSWETTIFPQRLFDYSTSWLDNLCFRGTVGWARINAKPKRTVPGLSSDTSGGKGAKPENAKGMAPGRSAPLAFFLREDASWVLANRTPAEVTSLCEKSRKVLGVLSDSGASFLSDILNSPTLMVGEQLAHPKDVEGALWELFAAGLATADGFACLRTLVDRQNGHMRSIFDQSRNAPNPRSKWQRSIKKARQRNTVRPFTAQKSLPTSAGRWSLLPTQQGNADAANWARQLLARYGVVFRDLLARETAMPKWRDLLPELRRLEARGEIRGGRFVSGFVGEQFALPEALDQLRVLRNISRRELVRISATDPLNLVGITSAGRKVPAVSGNEILYRDGVPIAAIEGGKLTKFEGLLENEQVGADLSYTSDSKGFSTSKLAISQGSLPLSAQNSNAVKNSAQLP